LIYMRARGYDPRTTVFLTRDPARPRRAATTRLVALAVASSLAGFLFSVGWAFAATAELAHLAHEDDLC
jgi:hypothetical protein